MTHNVAQNEQSFIWQPQPEAQRIVDGIVGDFLERCPGARALADRMRDETGTRFIDWIDHIQTPDQDSIGERLMTVGFEARPDRQTGDGCVVYVHDEAMFPPIVVGSGALRIGIKVESVADFRAAHQLIDSPVDGQPLGQLRVLRAYEGSSGVALLAVERHGTLAIRPDDAPVVVDPLLMLEHASRLRSRKRRFDDDVDGFAEVKSVVRDAVRDVGKDLACDLFFAAEREYWMRRNTAARVQKSRQDALGLGFANHDHHTYRSSRRFFPDLIEVLEVLGMYCREPFFAGEEAGWGAQVLEHPVTGIVVFADVDMDAEEITGDFAHKGFTERPASRGLGTVGLWCGLHGEAMLQAGLHHLECQFDWHALVEQLEREHGIRTLEPFTTFPYLRQAFTEGERWNVDPQRIENLLDRGLITPPQAEAFRCHGAVGSHLENLERNDGFKGFNQEGVSDIIGRTDPRKLAGVSDEQSSDSVDANQANDG